ncbi:MAG: flavodoxin domain-containing protein [Candidatus Omnitrophica bacterium]|jgi:flavorubredoxin|nr:flavodoxin domain-containing protein [Candidatus Omnitrophota bacterium]
MAGFEIKKGIYWVGAVDWNIRNFHGHTYTTNRGTTYNSYLIADDKITLVDAVYAPFANELIEKIKEIVPVEKIDYIVVNHIETDHSGALPALLKICPKAKLFGTAKCKEGLFRQYYQNWDFQIVKTGDKLNLGKRNLMFIEAPMIHWPDSMFTYCPEEELLLPNDAFGQHYATSERFDDETDACELMDEAAKYYGNILWPLGAVIARKIEDIMKMNIPIKMIAPSHGIIWRKDPAKIINAYLSWTKNETKRKAVIVYETMWGATEKMSRIIAQGLMDKGVETRLFDIATSDRSNVIKEMLDAKGFIIGSSTHDNDMLTSIAGFLEFLKGLSPKNRLGAAFGSFGWAGGAVKNIEAILKAGGVELIAPGLAVKYMPDEIETKNCYQLGVDFANKI